MQVISTTTIKDRSVIRVPKSEKGMVSLETYSSPTLKIRNMDIQLVESSKDGFQAKDEWSTAREMNLLYSNEEQ